ncbi:MAG: hypothetical protein H6Q41_3725 [Deltaproteobacteria bacterium]|nr:hypothetical protein [Deltaproteobacteria bacterium]
MISIAFLLLPGVVYPQSEQTGPNISPPVSQQLVPEATFALKLAPALQLGTSESETQAVDALASVGIEPKNGWIADYPVTPDIIGELQDAVAAAADSKKLPIERKEALKAFQDVAAEFNLAVLPGDSGTYAESQPQMSPEVINNYYDEEGPPVVTYYPPPWDYYYLYAWVPYPFWWGGFFFSGYFCLHDFHRTVFVGHRKCLVSNHFFDHKTKGVRRVDPARRGSGEAFRTGDTARHRGFNIPEARKGAQSIVERSRQRAATLGLGKGFNDGHFLRPKTEARSEQRTLTNRGNNTQPFERRSDRSVSQPNSFERRNEMNSRVSSPGEGRSSRDPGVTSERSFSAPSRSFSAPSRGSSSACANCHGGNSSFGRGDGGSSSRGFSGSGSSGGFSGGRSSGGSSGGGFSGGRGGGGGGGRGR